MKKGEIKDKYGNVLLEPYRCNFCNGYEDAARWRHMGLPEKHICFSCNFWREYAQDAANPNHVRIKGVHYVVCAEDTTRYPRGFGGRRFEILFKDGRRVVTTNLWCQSDIPNAWRQQLPDNARFVGEGD